MLLLFLPTLAIRQLLWHLKASQTSLDWCHFSHSSSPSAFLFKILKLSPQPWSVTDYRHVTAPHLEGFVVVVQSPSHVRLFVTPWTAACLASLFLTISRCLLKLMPFKSMMPSNHLILCRPFSSCLQSFPVIGVFSNKSALCIMRPKYWSFSFSISPSIEYSGLTSFWID